MMIDPLTRPILTDPTHLLTKRPKTLLKKKTINPHLSINQRSQAHTKTMARVTQDWHGPGHEYPYDPQKTTSIARNLVASSKNHPKYKRMDGVSSTNKTRPFIPTTHPRKSPTCNLSLISNCCQSSPLEKLIPRNTLNKLKLFVFSSHRCHRSSQERARDIYFWRCSPIMSFTNMASPSMNMYCDGHLMRVVNGSAFPVFSSVLSLRDEPLKLCRRVVSRGNIICSVAPESSTATGIFHVFFAHF